MSTRKPKKSKKNWCHRIDALSHKYGSVEILVDPAVARRNPGLVKNLAQAIIERVTR